MSFWYRNGGCSNNHNSHRPKKSKTRHRFGALFIFSSISVSALAQDSTPPGIVASLNVTQRLEYSDNPNLNENGSSDLFGRTILNFGLDSVTSLERFSLDLDTDIEEGVADQSTIDFVNSSIGLAYNRATRSARIGTTLRYRETDVNGDDFDGDFDQDGNAINQDSGTRETYEFGLSGAVRQDAPISADYGLNYREISYSGTSDPDFSDSTRLSFDGAVRFRNSPRITTRLIARYTDFDAQGDGVNRETKGLGLGADLQINPVLTADVALRYDNIERTGDQTGTDDGVSLDSSLTKALKNGSIGLVFNTDVTTNDDGRRSFLRLNRNTVLPRAQRLSYSLGVTRSDGTGVDPLVALNYTYSLPTSQISVGLNQTVVTDRNNDEEINTTLRASYSHDINNLSSLNATVSFFNRNELGEFANDGQRVNLSLSYRYALTRDWGLVSGYRYVLSRQDDRDDRDSNTVFIGLQRSFDWRP